MHNPSFHAIGIRARSICRYDAATIVCVPMYRGARMSKRSASRQYFPGCLLIVGQLRPRNTAFTVRYYPFVCFYTWVGISQPCYATHLPALPSPLDVRNPLPMTIARLLNQGGIHSNTSAGRLMLLPIHLIPRSGSISRGWPPDIVRSRAVKSSGYRFRPLRTLFSGTIAAITSSFRL